MKRRLALARLSLGRARMLLLDEPFSSLDRQGQKWFEEYLLAFRSGGGAVVLATHSFGRGIRVADRVAILAGGRLVLDRPAAELPWEELRRLYDTLTEANGGPA
jgi:ABC-type multidrug transport system ATPase subunit